MVFDSEKVRRLSDRERSIEYFDEIGSTNTELVCRTKCGEARCGDVVAAGRQSAGRGRRGRDFFSPDGGIYFSFTANNKDGTAPTLICGAAVANVLSRLGYEPEIKWVNDVLIGGKKVCGILAEAVTGTPLCVIGVGINVTSGAIPKELSDIASSLEDTAPCTASREEMIGSILAEYERLEALPQDEIIKIYKQYLRLLSREIVIKETGERCRALDLTLAGELRVRTESGEIRDLVSGEISIIKC